MVSRPEWPPGRDPVPVAGAIGGAILAAKTMDLGGARAAVARRVPSAVRDLRRRGAARRVVVFGAGPIGLGATIWLKLRGVEHVVVAAPRRAIPPRSSRGEHQERFARLISHRVPFPAVPRAFELALTPGAAEKVVVTFD